MIAEIGIFGNVPWHSDDEDNGVIRLVALKSLADGTELFIDYGVYAREII